VNTSETPVLKEKAEQAARQDPGAGRNAHSPAGIGLRGWMDILWRVYGQIGTDRVLAVAAGVTFYALLAIFPAITALVSLYGLFADPATAQDHFAELAGLLPGDSLALIGDQMKRVASGDDVKLGFGFVLGLGIALWSANAGMKALFDALNIAYEETERRGFIALTLLTLGFTLCAIIFVLCAMALIVVLPLLFSAVGFSATAGTVAAWARWPILFLGVCLGLCILYRYGPSRERAKWRWVTVGAVVAALVWMAASATFSWYVANFASYNETYGSLGAVIGFMTWLWISAIIVLVGGELNSEIEHQTAIDSTTGGALPLGQRGAEMADTVGEGRDGTSPAPEDKNRPAELRV